MAQEVVTATNKDGKDIYNYPSKDGTFKRQISSFRDFVSDAPGAKFPPEKGRYVRSSVPLLFTGNSGFGLRNGTDYEIRQVLYINLGCPWASRTNIVRTLKGLEDIIQIVLLDWEHFPEGWYVFLPSSTLIPYSSLLKTLSYQKARS
jgi:putative glutathione S-transferase